MDFLDYETFLNDRDDQGDNVTTQIQPALSLPILANIENLGKKFTSFNNLTRNLLKRDDTDTLPKKEDALTSKYAGLSYKSQKPLSSDDPTLLQNSYNSLTHRLSRVLNNPLPDSSIRETFTLLEDYIDPTDPSLIEPGISGTMTRKKLKSKIEEEVAKNQSQILKEYSPIVKKLKQTQAKVASIKFISEEMNQNIEENYLQSKELNAQVQELKKEENLLKYKRLILVAFKEKFTLHEYEEYLLTEGEINQEFFDTLAKAKLINENCSILLSMDNPELGLKIMTKVTATINKAVERIVSYTNKTLDNLFSLSSKHRLITLHQSLKYLKNNLKFNDIISNFTDSRSKTLVDEFINQTQGTIPDNLSSKSRSLIILAHDPIRYIGDLLAYVHSTVVNESETISSVFTIDSLDEKDSTEFKSIITDIINKILKALSNPIKSKIERVMVSETKLSTVYSIYELVDLYTTILSKQLPDSSDIIIVIKELVKSSQDRISTIINNRLITLSESQVAQDELDLDLQAPQWIVEFYSDVLPIVDKSTDRILSFTEEENNQFLNLITRKPIEIINKHVKESKVLQNQEDQLIIKVNSLDLILSKIMPFSLLSDKVLEINTLIIDLTSQLVQSQLDGLLKGCDLFDLYNVMNMIYTTSDEFFDVSIYEPIKENKFFDDEIIDKANTRVQEFLPNALMEIQQKLLKLNSPLIANEVTSESSLKFVVFYNKFSQVVQEYLDMTFTWSDFEIATLLGIDQEYEDSLKLSSS